MSPFLVSLVAAFGTVDHSSVRPERLTQLVREAVASSWENLISGTGRGTYRRFIKGRAADEFAFDIVFDGDKLNLTMTDLAHPRSPQRRFDRRIVVSDGSATFTRTFADRLEEGSRTTYTYPPGEAGIDVAAEMPVEPTKGTRGILAPEVFDAFSVHIVALPNGRLRGRYDLNEFVRAMFEASPDMGYNVVLLEVFNTEGARTGSRSTAEWKRDRGVWYVAAWTREEWRKGEVSVRYEFRYDEFAVNARPASELFSLQALKLQPDARIVDMRPGPGKVYNVGDPQKLAEKKLDTMAAQIETLPVRGQPKELQPNSRVGLWLWALNVIAILAIAGIWYVYWHRRKTIRRGKPS